MDSDEVPEGDAAPPADVVVEETQAPEQADRRRRLVQRGLALAAIMALVATTVVLLVTRKGEPSAAEALAEVRAFVQEERTATFTGTSESTFAPTDGDLGHTSTTRMRTSGRVRLPDAGYVLLEAGDYVEEYLVQGSDGYSRSAETRGELAAEKWTKWSGFGGPGTGIPPQAMVELDEGGAGAVADASGFMSAVGSGMPLQLEELFSKVGAPERLAPNRIRATVPLEDLVPEEVRQRLEELRAEAAAEAESDPEAEGDPDAQEDEEGDFYDVDMDDGTLTVTVEYGPEGRLDVLTFDTEHEGDDRSKDHEEYRFSNWGEPVSFEVPTGDNVDQTPHIDEEGVAKVQQQFTVLAPTAPPAGWALQAVDVEEHDRDSDTCAYVQLTYAGEEAVADDDGAEGDDEGPMISVASVEPECEFLEDNLPDLSEARTVRVGAWSAKVVEGNEDNYYTYLDSGLTFVFDVGTTTVVAGGNVPEAQLVQVLRSLEPLDLSKEKIGTGGWAAYEPAGE